MSLISPASHGAAGAVNIEIASLYKNFLLLGAVDNRNKMSLLQAKPRLHSVFERLGGHLRYSCYTSSTDSSINGSSPVLIYFHSAFPGAFKIGWHNYFSFVFQRITCGAYK